VWAGEPVRGLFAAPPFAVQLDVVVESMRTHAAEIGVHEDNAVLNACRALLWWAFGVKG
jgi:hypothetical protein